MNAAWRMFAGAVLISAVVAAFRFEQLAGDPEIYRSRMALLFDGGIPYVDFFFEHLPLAILPMALTWLLGGAFNALFYTVIFGVLMGLCLAISLRDVGRLGRRLGVAGAEMNWLAISAALFPIVLFRYDPFPTLLAVAALFAFVVGRDRAGVWLTTGGILAKGWPVVLSLTEWWRGRRWRATGLFALAAATFAFLLTLPGFTQARVFSGIHSETVFGGLFTLVRLRSGASLELITDAGATYVTVPTWAAAANLTLGVVVLALALYRSTGVFTWGSAVRLLAAATLAILLGSPLLSPQFLLWPTPFLALHSDSVVRRLAIAASVLTLIYMLGWNPGFEGDLWWVGVLNLRNLVLVALGVVAALSVADAGRRKANV